MFAKYAPIYGGEIKREIRMYDHCTGRPKQRHKRHGNTLVYLLPHATNGFGHIHNINLNCIAHSLLITLYSCFYIIDILGPG